MSESDLEIRHKHYYPIASLGLSYLIGGIVLVAISGATGDEDMNNWVPMYNIGVLSCYMIFFVVFNTQMTNKRSKIPIFWAAISLGDTIVCMYHIGMDSDIIIYEFFTTFFQSLLYCLCIYFETKYEFGFHMLNNFLRAFYFDNIHENTFVFKWFGIKFLLNISCFIIMLIYGTPLVLFKRYLELYNVEKVPKIAIIDDFGIDTMPKQTKYKLRKPDPKPKSICVSLPDTVPFSLSWTSASVKELTGVRLRNAVLSYARSNRIDMAQLPTDEVEHILLNTNFETLLVECRFNNKRLLVLWKDTIYRKRKQIQRFDIRVFFHFNTAVGSEQDNIEELIRDYNPTSSNDWTELIESYYDPIKILENVPSHLMIPMITRGRNYKKYFDIITSRTEISLHIMTSIPYRLLKRINKLNGYSLLERLAFSEDISSLPPSITNHLLRNISRSSRLVFRMTYRDLYPIKISWSWECPVKVSPFVNLTTHDWASLKITNGKLDEKQTYALNRGRTPFWWMMI